MGTKLKDMSLVRNAVKLSTMRESLQTLIKNIYNNENSKVIGNQRTRYFYNHAYDKDPDVNGRSGLGRGIKVDIYYQPATDHEYENWEVIHDDIYYKSGRRRLAVRVDSRSSDEEYGFYMTNHPQQRGGLRDNSYGVFTPINVDIEL